MSEDITCKDKAAYNSKKEADGAAVVAKWQHDSKLKSYKCKHCKLWHLSSDY